MERFCLPTLCVAVSHMTYDVADRQHKVQGFV
jgi:hypothetical protein